MLISVLDIHAGVMIAVFLILVIIATLVIVPLIIMVVYRRRLRAQGGFAVSQQWPVEGWVQECVMYIKLK